MPLFDALSYFSKLLKFHQMGVGAKLMARDKSPVLLKLDFTISRFVICVSGPNA